VAEVAYTIQGHVFVRQLEPAALAVGTTLACFDDPDAGVLVHQAVQAGHPAPPAVPVVLAAFH